MGYGVVSAYPGREGNTSQEPYLESAGEREARKQRRRKHRHLRKQRKTQTEICATKTFELEKIRQLDFKAAQTHRGYDSGFSGREDYTSQGVPTSWKIYGLKKRRQRQTGILWPDAGRPHYVNKAGCINSKSWSVLMAVECSCDAALSQHLKDNSKRSTTSRLHAFKSKEVQYWESCDLSCA